MLFNIMLHTVSKHYAIQYHAAYSMIAMQHDIEWHNAGLPYAA